MRVGLSAIAADPRRWLGLIPAKLSYTFDHESFPIGYLAEADPDSWPERTKERGRDFSSTVHRVMMGLAALSVAAWPFGRRMHLASRLTQASVIAIIVALSTRAALTCYRLKGRLAVFIPVAAALPLPGAPERTGVLGYLYISIAGVVATHAVFFGEDRYHMVVAPGFCLLAACALRRSDASAAQRVTGLRTQRKPSPGTS